MRPRLTPRTWGRAMFACLLLLLAAALVALLAAPPARHGVPRLGAREAGAALVGGGSEQARMVMWSARAPRATLAALCGACLGLAGAILQLVLRNPLADPYVLGVSSGAALGAVGGLALGASLGGGGHPVAAIAGAVLAGAVVHALARDRDGRIGLDRLLVAGVVLSYLLSAGVMWVVSLASAHEARNYLFWLMGSFGSASWTAVAAVALALLVSAALVAPAAAALNLLAVSEEHAADAGVEVERAKRLSLASAATLTGASVAAAGSVGFVGLVVPHSVRLLLGSDARLLLPASALGGAAFLLLADTVVRLLGEVPVGVATASCGAPFFLWLLWRRAGA